MITKILAFLKLSRLSFLTGGVIMYGLGVAVAIYEGYSFEPALFFWGQLIVTSAQLMVHFSNEYYDYEGDQLNLTPTYWSGGSRVLVKGELSIRVALIAAIGCALITLTASVVLSLIEGDIFLLLLLLMTIFLSWSYSSPPLQLHSRCLGEMIGTLILAAFTPFVGFYVQAKTLSPLIFGAVIPLLFLQFNMLLSVHIPDAEGDMQAGKKTLVVWYGREKIVALYTILIVMPYLSLLFLIGLGFPMPIALSILLALPLAIGLFWRRKDWENPKRWNILVFCSITLLMLTALLEMIFFLNESEAIRFF